MFACGGEGVNETGWRHPLTEIIESGGVNIYHRADGQNQLSKLSCDGHGEVNCARQWHPVVFGNTHVMAILNLPSAVYALFSHMHRLV